MITVIVKEPSKQAQVREIEYSYRKLQELVKGITYIVPFPNLIDVDLVTNDDEMVIERTENFTLPEYKDVDRVFGIVVICGFDKTGNAKSLTQDQIEQITDYLNANAVTKKQSEM